MPDRTKDIPVPWQVHIRVRISLWCLYDKSVSPGAWVDFPSFPRIVCHVPRTAEIERGISRDLLLTFAFIYIYVYTFASGGGPSDGDVLLFACFHAKPRRDVYDGRQETRVRTRTRRAKAMKAASL